MATKKVSQATPKTKKLGPSVAMLMTAPQRAVLAVQAAELMAGEAAERQREGGKKAGRGRPIAEGSKVPRLSGSKTSAKAAKAAGAGEKQVQAMIAVKKAAPEIFKSVQAGEVKTVAEPAASLTIGETPPALATTPKAAEVAPLASNPAPAAPSVPVVAELPISTIRLDGGTQSRASLSTTTIAEYAEAMTTGATFPPVVVFYDGKMRWLADGFHRVNASLKVGRFRIACEVRQGSQRDAILFSVAANVTHGLRRTNADKRHAVQVLIADPEWAMWSSREIAKVAAVDDKFVGKIRSKVSATADGPQLAARKGADGKVRKAPKVKKGRKAFNFERAAKAAPLALDQIAKQWPATESREPLLETVRAWLAVQSGSIAKAAA